jgi:hypothetical protein
VEGTSNDALNNADNPAGCDPIAELGPFNSMGALVESATWKERKNALSK